MGGGIWGWIGRQTDIITTIMHTSLPWNPGQKTPGSGAEIFLKAFHNALPKSDISIIISILRLQH